MIQLVGAGIANARSLHQLPEKGGEFRKFTRGMLLAHLSMEAALSSVGPRRESENLENWAMVLGSSLGELETTKEFLRTFDVSQVARPLLFQNSLHNSTLGTLVVRRVFKGPAITISNHYFTGEDCLLTAVDLLTAGLASVCIVTAVDSLVPDLEEALQKTYPPGTPLGEGAASVILANQQGIARLGFRPLAELQAIQFSRSHRKVAAEELPRNSYDSDGIEHLARVLLTGDVGANRVLHLLKPDGRSSRIELAASTVA